MVQHKNIVQNGEEERDGPVGEACEGLIVYARENGWLVNRSDRAKNKVEKF